MKHHAAGKAPSWFAWTVLFAQAVSTPLHAGNGLINVNQHRTFDPGAGCTYTGSCAPGGTGIPLSGISACQGVLGIDDWAEVPTVDSFSYHVGPDPSPLQGRFCQATCVYQYHARPKIISDDWDIPEAADLEAWLAAVCADDDGEPLQTGRLHFEHWENSLEDIVDNGGSVGSEFTTWPTEARNALNLYPDACATSLDQNGTLARPTATTLGWERIDQSEGEVTDPAVLLGFGFMGALAAGDRFSDPGGFFHVMHWKHANLMRVWSLEQWAAVGLDESGCDSEGPTPFIGSYCDNSTNKFDLRYLSPRFFSILRRFVQAAADRGVVIQLSLFDKHGLMNLPTSCSTPEGSFITSPYKDENNDPPTYFDAESTCATCNTGPLSRPMGSTDPFDGCTPPSGFTALSGNHYDRNLAFIRRCAEEVGGIGNVIFEIVNEARGPNSGTYDWPDTNECWQAKTSMDLDLNLPVSVVRDAFNGSASHTALQGRKPDRRQASADVWNAPNVKMPFHDGVRESEGSVAGRSALPWLGYVTRPRRLCRDVRIAAVRGTDALDEAPVPVRYHGGGWRG